MNSEERPVDTTQKLGSVAVEKFRDKLEQWARIFALVGIPVILGIGGWVVQENVQQQMTADKAANDSRVLSSEYLKIAVSVLAEQKSAKDNPALRSWAVDLLIKNTPVPLANALAAGLRSGKTVLPAYVSDATTTGLGSIVDEDLRKESLALQQVQAAKTLKTANHHKGTILNGLFK